MTLQNALLRYADCLFARAVTLRETGDVETAEKYEQRAIEFLDQASIKAQEAKTE